MRYPEPPFIEMGFYMDLGAHEALVTVLHALLTQARSLGQSAEVVQVPRGASVYLRTQDSFLAEIEIHGLADIERVAKQQERLLRRVEVRADRDGTPEIVSLVPLIGSAKTTERNPVTIWRGHDPRAVRETGPLFTDLVRLVRPLYASAGVEATLEPPSRLKVESDVDLFSSGFVKVPPGRHATALHRAVEELGGSWAEMAGGVRFDLPGSFGREGEREPEDRDRAISSLVAEWYAVWPPA